MKQTWIINKRSSKLILFFCGWGNDDLPFKPLPSHEYDVLCLYAYHQPGEVNFNEIISQFTSVSVIAWSMGVLQAYIHCEAFQDKLEHSLAINGSLLPVHDNYGIGRTAYQLTIDSFSEIARKKFFQRMCKERKILSTFLEHAPDRQLLEQKEELVYHQNQSDKFGVNCHSYFDTVVIGEADLIFPPENLKRFWEGHKNVIELNLPHFLFYAFCSWDEIVNL